MWTGEERIVTNSSSAVDLYWIPLGAGARFVRFNGRVYEALSATVGHRTRCDLYHSALEVTVDGARFAIEMTPIPDRDGARRGVVREGPVGSHLARGLRLFRYEIRRWPGGVIPDAAYAVGGPMRLTTDPDRARRLLELVPSVPTLVWGRDELNAGDMWNSNSVVAWLLARSGVDTTSIQPPEGGRAPGWHAGLLAADRPSGSETGMNSAPALPHQTPAWLDRHGAHPLGTPSCRRDVLT